MPDIEYGYYWFRHHTDGSTFIALRAEDNGEWYMPAIDHPIKHIMKYATLLGPVPRQTTTGASIDQ